MSLAFANAAVHLVLEHGPLTLVQLHELALAAGSTRARSSTSLRTSLAHDPRFVVRPDGTFDTAARLLRGATLVTRLRHPLPGGVLWVHRDLDPLLGLHRDHSLPLSTGGRLTLGASSAACWVGPAGWADAVGDAPVLALTWDGHAATVSGLSVTPDIDDERVRQVRLTLARHARSLPPQPYRYGVDARPTLTQVSLSALLEDPDLFTEPLPPLSELLPLPEDLRPQDAWGELRDGHGTPLELQLPLRVHDELGRRADLLGERLPDYAAMLLGAAADRLQLPPPRYYPEPYDQRWVEPSSWGADEGGTTGEVVLLRDRSR